MSDFRLAYYSANRIPPARLQEEIDAILGASRRNNALVGISGVLMFSTGYFAQVLEGSQSTIESTFERIQLDRRHGQVHLLEFVPAPVRSFQTWSMAFIGSTAEVSPEVSGIAGRSGFDPRVFDSEQLVDKLRELLGDQD